ncbi:MAG: helix-turn-helix family protein [Micavibrio sp.]|nr:helix-turn-helix family protein [Micavibrio sp.]
MDNNFVTRVEKLVRDSGGQSALARASGLSLGAIQRYLKGGEPTRGALIRLAESGGVSLTWLVFGTDVEAKPTPSRGEIPVYGFAECGLQGWYNEVRYRVATSLDWPDPEMFAVIVAGHSMAPEGIHPGFICMASPATRPQKGDAVLIRKRDRTATIKVYQKEDKDWLTVNGWLDPETPGAAQTAYTDKIKRDTIDRLATIIMVKRRT